MFAERSSRYSRKAYSLTLILAAVMLAGGAAGAQSLQEAPANPGFEAWQNALFSGVRVLTAGEVAGYVPAPFDRTHLQDQVVSKAFRVTTAVPAYSLVPLGYVTPVKNQAACGSCWTFATYGSLESALLMSDAEEWDFSENHLKNYHGFDFGPCEGGNDDMSVAYLTRWDGPVSELNDPYNDYDDRPSPGGPAEKIVDRVLVFTTPESIKDAVVAHGALSVSMYWFSTYYNSSTYTYYCSKGRTLNHAVTLVGWDDAKSVPGAPGPGAWLIKNSWGAGWGNAGYFWLSYYDVNSVKDAYAYSGVGPGAYRANYQYDPLGLISAVGYSTTTAWAANVFTATANEYLGAVGFHALAHNTAYQIYIYDTFSGGTFSSPLMWTWGTLANAGYHTIPLPSLVRLTSGDQFAIVVKLTTPGYNYPVPMERPYAGYSSGATASLGQSFLSSNGTSWTDLASVYANTNVCIKGLVAAAGFTGGPDEYTYALDTNGDITVTDLVPGRDGAVTLPYDTTEAWFYLGDPQGGLLCDPVNLPDPPQYGILFNIIPGTEGDDTLVGYGTIEDDAAGLNNRDVILGFGGNDSLRGINGTDFLFGHGGNDRLYGDNDDDYLLAGDGNDVLYPGTGDDQSYGDGGNDIVVLAQPANPNQVYQGGDGLADKLLLANGYGSFTLNEMLGFEKFTGGDGNDYVDWSMATVPVEMRSNAGNDTLIGGSGNDLLQGGAGTDTLTGNGGNDRIYGDDGDDVISGGDGTDTIYTGSGNDTADAGPGNNDRIVLADASPDDNVNGGDGGGDTLILQDGYGSFAMTSLQGFEVFTGGDGDDSIDWSSATAAVTIRGNAGEDLLIGGEGNDLITGGPDNDVIFGNGGADIIYGEGGVNHLIGGPGNDGIRGGGADYPHFGATPEPPRYSVRNMLTYIVVTDITGDDGMDVVRGCPLANLAGPYVP